MTGRDPASSHSRHQREAATTIYDVAREAGVATSTVSRAFTNPARVSVRTREHVVAVAERLDYRPNPLARALPSGRTSTIALLIPDITNPFFFGLIRGAGRQARAAGLTVVLADTEETPEREIHDVERLTRAVDGFVLASSRLSGAQIGDLASRRPLTLVNRTVDGIPSVTVDTADGTRQIIEHLASLGHRVIAYLSGPRNSWSNTVRWRALQTATRRMGMSATRLGPFAPQVASGAPAADAAIGSGATAVVAFNDLIAIGALRRFAERGLRVPTDISVVGYDDVFGADFCSPALTTLAAPIEDAGRSAVDLLLERVNVQTGHSVRRQIVLASQLRIRDSTGPVRQG